MNQFLSPPRMIFGEGSLSGLGDESVDLGARKVVLVTDQVLSSQTDSVAKAVALLETSGVEVEIFDEVEPSPSVATVRKVVSFARSFGPGAIIGLGGGSPMDVAKALAVILGNATPLDRMLGWEKVPEPALPLLLLPTTGGTGSEASKSCVLTDVTADGSHEKVFMSSPFVVTRTAIIDPELSVTVPPAVTAATGLDALTHAIETYVSKEAQPLTDVLALEAICLIGKYLRRAVADGSDLEARRAMSYAALMAGLAFSNARLGVVHAIAMVLGGHFNVTHGVANALMLPHVMEFNEMSMTSRFAKIAEALGERIERMSERDAARQASISVHGLVADVGILRCLSDIGISEDAIPFLAEEAFKQHELRAANPRSTTMNDLVKILERAA